MDISRFRPLGYSIQDELNRLYNLDELFNLRDLSRVATSDWCPSVDIKEEDTRFKIIADIPGVDPKDIEVKMEDGSLTMKGTKTTESKEERDNFSRVERFSGQFYRRFALPDTADGNNIAADSKHGVLTISIPKKSQTEIKRIEIKSEE